MVKLGTKFSLIREITEDHNFFISFSYSRIGEDYRIYFIRYHLVKLFK